MIIINGVKIDGYKEQLEKMLKLTKLEMVDQKRMEKYYART